MLDWLMDCHVDYLWIIMMYLPSNFDINLFHENNWWECDVMQLFIHTVKHSDIYKKKFCSTEEIMPYRFGMFMFGWTIPLSVPFW